MKKILAGVIFLAVLTCTLYAQVAPSIEWQKSFGGSNGETAQTVRQTTDGGFIVAGYSKSINGDVSGNHGNTDYWVLRLDSAGNLVWQKSLGGSSFDEEWGLELTSDGGCIIAGQTKSNDGDVSGNHGLDDYWIVKLDADGNIDWQKCLGGSDYDIAYSAHETSDGGYIVAGHSESNDGDVTGNHGEFDFWIVKLDATGNLVWQKSLGGSSEDEVYSVQQTSDGGFIVTGETESNDGDVSGNHGDADIWLVKLDADGNLVWQKCLGGTSDEEAYAVQQTIDGGFIVAGPAASNDGDVSGNHGDSDYWILKLDDDGNLVWQKSLGGSDYDFATSVQQTTDSGYIVGGYSHSIDGDISENKGANDYWIVKLDATGNLEWEKSLGGSSYERANSVQQTTDGDFIVAGLSFSNDGDVSGNHGDSNGTTQDYWIVKLTSDSLTGIASPVTNFISLYPNPVQAQLTLTLETPANDVTIRVYDLQGKIRQTALSGQTNKIKLNTENLPAGFYTLQITNNKTGVNEKGKFIKL